LRPFNSNLTVIDIKNFPFLGLIMESLGEKQAKRCLTEFSGVWAYTPNLLNAGADLVDIQALLGHTNLATTPIYTHVSEERMQAVVAKLTKR